MRPALRAVGAVGASVLGTLAGSPIAFGAPVQSTLLFRLADPRLVEVSGIAAGIVSPDVFYVHNDSGDSARFFALDRRTGAVRAEFSVPGATNVDWEDIAVAKDARGVASVWLADIGDNSGSRKDVVIYRVDEPVVGSGPAVRRSASPEVWRLTYPGGARDAESLAVAPGGTAYIVTKSPVGISSVYRVPVTSAGGRTQSLEYVGTVRFSVVKVGDPAMYPYQLSATSAAFGDNGSLLVVRTYDYAHGWRVDGGNVAGALSRHPDVSYELPKQPQGEGVTIVGDQMVIDSEQVGSPVYSLPLRDAEPSPASSASSSSAPRAIGSRPTDPNRESTASTWWRLLGVVGLVVGALVVVAIVRGRRGGYRESR